MYIYIYVCIYIDIISKKLFGRNHTEKSYSLIELYIYFIHNILFISAQNANYAWVTAPIVNYQSIGFEIIRLFRWEMYHFWWE